MSTDSIMSAGPASTAPTNKSVWRRLLKNPMAAGSLVVFIAIVIFGVAAPLLAPFDPNLAKLELTNAAPFDTEFLLGGDRSGRDILSRLMYATTGTLMACLVVLAVSAGIGIVTGLVAGYWGGRIDDVLDWVSNIVLAFPDSFFSSRSTPSWGRTSLSPWRFWACSLPPTSSGWSAPLS